MSCPVCGSDNAKISFVDTNHSFVECDACGRFEINTYPVYYENRPKDNNKLASYLFYNNGKSYMPINVDRDDFFNFIGMKERYESTKEKHNYCFWVTNDVVEAWYPKTFNEKVNTFLLHLGEKSNYMGDIVLFTEESLKSACFVVRDPKGFYENGDQIEAQLQTFLKYLLDEGLIERYANGFSLLPNGWKRVDELQKHNPNSKNVFVAMSFAPEMQPVRDAIKKAITDCGYIPRIMDEIEHNHQIVPEMLYEIRNSRFIIAELTGHNNGAYFEAGYALGQGKSVIQVCKSDAFGKDGHFDVKQVNTVLWNDETELTGKLIKRIQATI